MYMRDEPLCTVGAGFPAVDGGMGRAALLPHGCLLQLKLYDAAARHRRAARSAIPTSCWAPGCSRTARSWPQPDPTTSEAVRSILVQVAPVRRGYHPPAARAASHGRDAISVVCPHHRAARGRRSHAPRRLHDGPHRPSPRRAPPCREASDASSSCPPRATRTLNGRSLTERRLPGPDPRGLQYLDRAGLEVGMVGLDVPDADLLGDPAGRGPPGRRRRQAAGTGGPVRGPSRWIPRSSRRSGPSPARWAPASCIRAGCWSRFRPACSSSTPSAASACGPCPSTVPTAPRRSRSPCSATSCSNSAAPSWWRCVRRRELIETEDRLSPRCAT